MKRFGEFPKISAMAGLATLMLALLAAPSWADSPVERYADLDGMRVHYVDHGRGREALIFVHGWSCDLGFWDANVQAFTGRSRVIAVDLPGHGRSDKPQIAYSMDLFARAVDAVMRDAGVRKATLIGHSMGTPVIRQFYRKYPSKTRALVIVDGALRPFGTREQMEPFIARFRSPDYRKAIEDFINFLAQSSKDKNQLEKIKASMTATPQHVVVGAMEAQYDPAIWKDQDRIGVPTLAIMAANPAWNADYEKFVRELVPGIDYQVWSGVTHFLMMDEPGKFNEAVLGFLARNRLIRK